MEESSTNSIKNSGSHTRGKRQKSRKKDVHITLDEEVVGGLKAEGFNISALANKLLKEHLEKVRRMEAIISRMAGPPGFEPGTTGSEGRRHIP